MNWFTSHINDIATIVGYASVVASFTKTNWDNVALDFISKFIHTVALNVGESRPGPVVKLPQNSTATVNVTKKDNFNE